jgi:hypothetical protein
MTVPGLPALDPADAENHGWRIAPDAAGNLWLRVIDGVGAICFGPQTHIAHDGDGAISGSGQVIGLVSSVDPDGYLWLSEGGDVTAGKVLLTRQFHALIVAPDGLLRREGAKLLYRGIEFAGPAKPAA